MSTTRSDVCGASFLGVGIGLRPTHYAEILAATDFAPIGVDFFEAISENFLVPGGRPLRILEEVRSRCPLVFHGVSMNVGSADPLSPAYLDDLRALVSRFEPEWISDHLCWTGVAGRNLHDLLPLPYTESVLRHVSERVMRAQDRLGRRIALENPSSYFAFQSDAMPEWEFLARLVERADCGILLDVNNVYVSAQNHGFDAETYVSAIPMGRVVQIHLAGHSRQGSILIDTHDHPVCPEVWDLFERAVRRLGPISTLIEWDDRIPELAVVAGEAARARAILSRVAKENLDAFDHDPRRRATSPVAADHGL